MNYKDLKNNVHAVEPEFAHLLPNGCVPITDAEAEALRPLPVPPTPLQQIRALEQAHDDDQRKLTRMLILELALDKECQQSGMANKTRAQVHAIYFAANRSYRELSVLETEVAKLRPFVV